TSPPWWSGRPPRPPAAATPRRARARWGRGPPPAEPDRPRAMVRGRMREPRLFYGWIVLGAAATTICIAMGAMFSLAVYFKPIEDTMRWSRTGISGIAGLNWLAMGVGSLVWGRL